MKMKYLYPKNWEKEEGKIIRELTKKSDQFYTKYKLKLKEIKKIF